MANQTEAYQQLVSQLQDVALLRSCGAVLGWDEQTYLPKQGGEHRANQLAALAGLSHERATSPQIGELLSQLNGATFPEASIESAIIREANRDYQRSAKLPKQLVEEMSRVTTLSQQAWVEARQKKSFADFEPWLSKVVKLKQEEADALGSATGIRYDALLEDYEPGATSEQIQSVFEPLKNELVQLVAAIKESEVKPDISILTRSYPVELQKSLSLAAAEMIGFDFDAGRLDIAAHPFCSGIGPGDCRLTTRYDEHHFPGAFFGTLHEAGHGIYEQGLPAQGFGLATGIACSLGIHESQSRMWENLVGRSRAFWDHFYTQAQSTFADALGDVSLDEFYTAINDVRPSWIRVEADEVTYNLHIMLRFEIEQALISGDLQAKDLPGIWNERFQEYFGLTPSDDSIGCMQDVHWSAGLIGYFPTYSLGNMYAAQIFVKAEQDLGDLNAMFAQGEFLTLKKWLNENVHVHGRRYYAPDLLKVVSEETLSPDPLLDHLKTKFGALYNL